MSDTVILVLLIVALVLIVALFIFMIVSKVKSPVGSEVKVDNKEITEAINANNARLYEAIGSIRTDITNLSKDLQSSVSSKMAEDINNQFERLREKVDGLRQNVTNVLNETKDSNTRSFAELTKNIYETQAKQNEALSGTIEKQLTQINDKVDDRLKKSFETTNETFTNITEQLTNIKNAAEKMDKLNEEVVGLQKTLSGNQSRGRYGEMALEAILGSVFGETRGIYDTQYSIKFDEENTVRPDAVIFMPDSGVLCIDSKFPDIKDLLDLNKDDPRYSEQLKEFKGNVIKHIDKIAHDYIIPGKTAEEAIMFVPSDGEFAFIHSTLYKEIVEKAQKKRVVITSPSTLQPILFTIKSIKLNQDRAQSVNKVLNLIRQFMEGFDQFSKGWTEYNTALNTLVNKKANTVDTRINKITKRFDKIRNLTVSDDEEKEIIAIEENDSEEDEEKLEV